MRSRLIKIVALIIGIYGIALIIVDFDYLGLVGLLLLWLIAIPFIFLPPKIIRKVYPGWRQVEALMWRSEFFNKILRLLAGEKGYREAELEWFKSMKEEGKG